MTIDAKSLVQETYYKILSVDENATYEEIRTSYRTAIVKSHPDKIQSINHISNSDPTFKDTFHKIQKAWEILSSSTSRAIYDSKLKTARRDLIMADDVYIEDMIAQDDGEVMLFHYQCRCGDYFCTDSLELESVGYIVKIVNKGVSFQASNDPDTSVILPCMSCSLRIRLLVGSESRLVIED